MNHYQKDNARKKAHFESLLIHEEKYNPDNGLVEVDAEVMELDFAEWLDRVNVAVESQIGLSCHDLTDFMYRDAFDDGCNPESVAHDVIANDSTFSAIFG